MTNRFLSVFCFLIFSLASQAQNKFEPVHGLTGFDYQIKGELMLHFTNAIDYKNGSKQEAVYTIKSPVILTFNLNDLKFFKARPDQFKGYVENRYDAFSGFPGGLLEIPEGGQREEENWMEVSVQFTSHEQDVVSSVNAHGEIYPVLQAAFSAPDFPEKLHTGLTGMQFRMMISGIADAQYHPQRNVAGKAALGPIVLTEGFDLPVSVGCGTFYGLDLNNALASNNQENANETEAIAFEEAFEKAYFKDLPQIDAMKLIDFLINPTGTYEAPFAGSFRSDSETGSEQASYKGTLRLWGNQLSKSN
jgi:hypothetical protein